MLVAWFLFLGFIARVASMHIVCLEGVGKDPRVKYIDDAKQSAKCEQDLHSHEQP